MTVARVLWAAVFLIAALPRPSAAQSAPSAATTPTAEATASPWGWLKMPKITMPKIEMPKMPADPLAPIKTSARKVGDGTKRAWEGTKELFTFGGSKTDQPVARTASAAEPPSMWKRMFGAEEQPREPQSVAEWMNQPRLDP